MFKFLSLLLTLFSLVSFSKEQLGLDNLGASIQSRVQESLKPLENLGSRINKQVKEQLSGLENLGDRINEEVYKGLEPVRILESIVKVKLGNGGTTIATFSPSSKQIIIRNEEYYTCGGTIDSNDGRCSGELQKIQFQKKEDFCFVTNKNTINDWFCIAPNSNFRVISYINGKVICETQNGTPKLLIQINEFQNMCKDIANSVTYKYFTNYPLEHTGNGLTCSATKPQVCSYSESLNNNDNFQGIIIA